jgi:hypothetical protein
VRNERAEAEILEHTKILKGFLGFEAEAFEPGLQIVRYYVWLSMIGMV